MCQGQPLVLHAAAAFLGRPLKCFHTLRITQQFLSQIPRGVCQTRRVTHRFDLCLLICQLCIVEHRRDYPVPMMTPNQEESDFDDISWPLLSIYYDAAKEEDDEMVARWRSDAKGIVIFVSPCAGIRTAL